MGSRGGMTHPQVILVDMADFKEVIKDTWLAGFQSAIDAVWAMSNDVTDPSAKTGIQVIACALENMKP